jgi:hypothetical protein
VLLANSLGSFDPAQVYPAGSQPRSVAMAKFNSDNVIDLVVANADAGTVSVLLGTGTGFRLPVNSAVGSYPLGVAVGDFNGTGGPDLATANNGSGNVSVLLNNGIWPALNAPSVTVSNASLAEGQTGTTAMEFTVTLSAASLQTVTVHYATANGSAVAGNDFLSAEGTLTFLPTVTSLTIPVDIIGDRVVEPGEYFYLRLSDATNAFLDQATGTGSIVDDEPRVSIDYGPVRITEGNTGTTNALFTVRLSAPYDEPVNVNFSTVEGDTDYPGGYGYYNYYYPATSGSDFQPPSNVILTFAPEETEKTILVAVNGDRLAEYDEYFSVNLSGSDYGTIIAPHAVGIIVNDEPYASIDNSTVAEGNSGTTALTFTISLSAAPDASNAPVTVNYATADGSATVAGGDYQAKIDTVSFGIGETSKQITVLVNGDRLPEYDESFYVNLTGANGAVLSYYATGYGTIVDDEPRLSINSPRITEGNSGTKLLTFTVTLLAAYDQAVTVHYATQDGSATAGTDYVATSGTLTFAPFQTTKTITVTIKGDKQKETDEYFYVILSDASSNVMISNSGIGTILNDEPGKGPGKGPGKH